MKMPMPSGSTRGGGVPFGIRVVFAWVYLVTQRLAAGSDLPFEILQACGTPRTPPANVSNGVLLFFHPADIGAFSQCVCSFIPGATGAPPTSYSVKRLLGDSGVNITSGKGHWTRGKRASPGSAAAPPSNSSILSSSSVSSSAPSSSTSSTPTPTMNANSTTATAAADSSSIAVNGSTVSNTDTTTISDINTSTSDIASSSTSGSHSNEPASSTSAIIPTNTISTAAAATTTTTNNNNDVTNISTGGGEVLTITLDGRQTSTFVVLVVKANNSVNISCDQTPRAATPTPSQGVLSTGENDDTPVTTSPSSLPTASMPDTFEGSASKDQTNKADGSALGVGTGQMDKADDGGNGQNQLMFALGCASLVVAVVIIVAAGWFVFRARRERRKRPSGQAESGPDKKRQRGNKASSNNGAASLGAGLNNSQRSLISEGGHNYEDMRVEDEVAEEDSPRKASAFSTVSSASHHQHQHQHHSQTKKHSPPQPDTYSHIPSSRPPPAPPTAGGNGGDDSDDEYNRLNLSPRIPLDTCVKTTPTTASSSSATAAPKSGKSASATAAAPKSFFIGDENNDYSEVGDEGDIYEAVDEPEPDNIYTDCASINNSNAQKQGDGKVKPGVPPLRTTQLPAHMAAKGLRRFKSRSVDMSKVEVLRMKAAAAAASGTGGEAGDRRIAGDGEGEGWKGHKHSKSVDFNCSSTNPFLCQQRDLYLEEFKNQQVAGGGGGGAGVVVPGTQRAATQQPPAPAPYTDVCVVRGAEGTAVPPPAIPSRPLRALVPAHNNNSSNNNNNNQKLNGAANSNTSAAPPPSASGAAAASDGAQPAVMLRRQTQRRSSKKKVNQDTPPTMVDHLKEVNTELLKMQTAVRRSMEIKEDEFIMIDNVIYGTLPRNNSLPTTEL